MSQCQNIWCHGATVQWQWWWGITQNDDNDSLTTWWWRGTTQNDDSVPLAQIMIMGNNTRWRRTPLLMKYSNKNLYATNWLHRTLWSWFVHLPKALAKLWFTTFVKTAPCQTWKSLTKTPVSIVSRYCIQPLKRFASNPIARQYLLQLQSSAL